MNNKIKDGGPAFPEFPLRMESKDKFDDGMARIWPQKGPAIGHFYFDADASFIVRACNSHYELLEACKKALFTLTSLEGRFPETEDKLREAIAKVERK